VSRDRCQQRPDTLGTGANYAAWHADADRRREQGREDQRFCHRCRRWVWADLWDKSDPVMPDEGGRF